MAALPKMRVELSLSPAGVQWAINAYLVASAACIVLGGRAADRFGARAGSMFGVGLFAAASCVIAISGTQTALLAGRSLQGLAAALAVPCTLAAVDAGAAPERRAAAIGAWTGFLMLGFSIGPLIGGALTHIVELARDLLAQRSPRGGPLWRSWPPRARRRRRQSRRNGDASTGSGFILLATFMIALVFGLHALPDARAGADAR